MKKLYIYLFLAALLFNSCDDFLDIPPKNVITVQEEGDVEMLVGSYLRKVELKQPRMHYSIFSTSGPGHWGSNESFRYFEDDLDFSGMYPLLLNFFEEREFRWKSSSYEYGIWNALYKNIGEFNLFIHEMNNLGNDTELIKSLKSEVLMHRALTYFRLVQYFCPYRANEYANNPEKYGLPIIKSLEDLNNNYFPKRLNQFDTYQFILNDLREVEKINASVNDANLLFNKRSLYGLLADVYMFKAESPAHEDSDWENARNYALKSIENCSLINTKNLLEDLFNPQAISGSPAVRICLPNSSQEKYGYFYNSMFNVVLVEDEVYNLYDPNDIRRDFYISDTKKVIKYELADDVSKTVYPMYRVGEMYLVIAESYIRQNDKEKALKYLNEFKQSRIPGYTSYQQEDILDEIIRERRKEFLCECNYRWIDMKRNGIVVNRISSKNEAVKLEANDYRYTFIIPQAGELEHNVNNFQNPGWDLQEDEK